MVERDTDRKKWSLPGLTIALVGLPILTAGYRLSIGEFSTIGQVAFREAAASVLLLSLLWIVAYGERLPLRSIGLRHNVGRSLAWGLLLFIFLGLATAAALGLLHLLGLSYGHERAFVPPLWLMALVVLRAGVVEEVFYRGYAIERIAMLTRSRLAAGALSLTAFALSHVHQGISGIVVALVLGTILTGFYLWRRNLVANIVGHFLINFVPNILLPMLGS